MLHEKPAPFRVNLFPYLVWYPMISGRRRGRCFVICGSVERRNGREQGVGDLAGDLTGDKPLSRKWISERRNAGFDYSFSGVNR